MERHEPNSPEEARQLKKILWWIVGSIVVAFLIFGVFLNPDPLTVPDRKRYSLEGDEIQSNGLTVEQELEIASHCNEKPNAWDCR